MEHISERAMQLNQSKYKEENNKWKSRNKVGKIDIIERSNKPQDYSLKNNKIGKTLKVIKEGPETNNVNYK
jgi:hypothetical protein